MYSVLRVRFFLTNSNFGKVNNSCQYELYPAPVALDWGGMRLVEIQQVTLLP